MSRLSIVEQALSSSLSFLQPWRALVNSCMVDFITDDLWSQLVPDQLGEQLLKLSRDQLLQLPAADPTVFSAGRVRQLCRELRRHSLVGCGILDRPVQQAPTPPYLDRFMQNKKHHEASVMAASVAALCEDHGVDRLVEIGSGRGYLGTLISLTYRLPVLSVEGNTTHLEGAAHLNKLIQRSWRNIVKRTEALRLGEWPGVGSKFSRRRKRSLPDPALPVEPVPPFSSCHCHVDSSTRLSALMDSVGGCGGDYRGAVDSNVALVGLHTCGDLAAHCINIFVNQSVRLLVNVPCCYHKLTESSPASSSAPAGAETTAGLEVGAGDTGGVTYPLSRFLRNFPGAGLGYNIRSMSVQPAERIAANRQEPNPTLYYRALLEVLVRDILGSRAPRLSVGKLSRRCTEFLPYMRLALQQYPLDSQSITDEMLMDYYQRYIEYKQRLEVFSLLRAALAPVVEAILLMDRLCFLLEQDVVEEAKLVRLFDPVTSPRCYALIAWKSN